jgi:hypothetical protein
MNTNGAAMELRSATAPSRIGQATAVEQSRAVAEVQAQVIVAQQMPRSIERAEREMRRSCARRALAEKAFYRFPRGGQQLNGESVVLARELARCWGNVDYGIAELRRDDAAGESEMMAYAWDLEANTRPRTTFIVPHLRDKKKGGPERLTDVRDVYENNANMGARRVREMIFNILPPWFVDEAKAACYATLAADDSDGATVAERAARAVERFGRIGVTAAQLTQKLGAPQAAWSAADLAQLTVIFRSIERGEATAEAEFGAAPDRITGGDLATPDASPAGGQQQPTPPAAGSATPPADPAGEARERPPAKATTGQVSVIRRRMRELGYGDEPDEEAARLRATARLAGRKGELASTKDLTQPEAALVRQRIDGLPDAAALHALLDELREAETQDAAGEPDGE